MKLHPKLKKELEDFIDSFETEYGNIEGFEVRLEHSPTADNDEPAMIKSIVFYRIEKTKLDI